MSETSGGDGWWLASDGKWYPPEQQASPPPPPSTESTSNTATASRSVTPGEPKPRSKWFSGWRKWLLIGFGGLIVLGGISNAINPPEEDTEEVRTEESAQAEDESVQDLEEAEPEATEPTEVPATEVPTATPTATPEPTPVPDLSAFEPAEAEFIAGEWSAGRYESLNAQGVLSKGTDACADIVESGETDSDAGTSAAQILCPTAIEDYAAAAAAAFAEENAAYLEIFRREAPEVDVDDEAAVGLGRAICGVKETGPGHSRDAILHSYSRRDGDGGSAARAAVLAAYDTSCPETDPAVFTGTGDAVFPITTENFANFAIVFAKHDGSRNFIVSFLDSNGERTEGLVNEIGSYEGWSMTAGDDVAFLQVAADGAWTVDLQQITTGASVELQAGVAISGPGNEVLALDLDGPVIVDFSCPGCDGNVIVKHYGNGRALVNEIGSYSGSFVIPGDTLLVEIQTFDRRGDSSWTLTPQS